MFLEEDFSAHQGCIYLIINLEKIKKYDYYSK